MDGTLKRGEQIQLLFISFSGIVGGKDHCSLNFEEGGITSKLRQRNALSHHMARLSPLSFSNFYASQKN